MSRGVNVVNQFGELNLWHNPVVFVFFCSLKLRQHPSRAFLVFVFCKHAIARINICVCRTFSCRAAPDKSYSGPQKIINCLPSPADYKTASSPVCLWGSVSCSKKRCVLAGSRGCWGGRVCSPSWKLRSLEYALGMYWCTISQENRAWRQDFWLVVLGRKEFSSIVFGSSLKRQIDGLGLLGIAADSLKYHVSALLCWCELLSARHYVPKDSQWLSSSDTW